MIANNRYYSNGFEIVGVSVMNMKIILVTCVFVVAITGCKTQEATDTAKLIDLNYCESDNHKCSCQMRIVEVERNRDTSKLQVTKGQNHCPSVGSSMFVGMAAYEVAKARGNEYFVKLKEWGEPDGRYFLIVGFSDNEDPDIQKRFGSEYAVLEDEPLYLKVSDFKDIFEAK